MMKLTKEKLKQIIKEELQDMSEEIDGKFKLVHKPSSPGQHGCKEDYLYDEDLHLCIRDSPCSKSIYGQGRQIPVFLYPNPTFLQKCFNCNPRNYHLLSLLSPMIPNRTKNE